MNPESLQRELEEKLNALPQTENRLLYDIDYDAGQVIEAAKQLLGKNAFPLSPRLNSYRLLILAAFASAMADDELAEYDTFYNRLSEIFFENAPIDVNKQNQIRDFVEETCERDHLRFLRNQNRLVRNTIWLHGGLPSRHWQSFFERVLMEVEDSLSNLQTLLDPPTPRTIKRFFDQCDRSARAFLRVCIEMRDAGLAGELDAYSAEDFDVSENFLDAFKEFLKGKKYDRIPRQSIVFDVINLRPIDERAGQIIRPIQEVYAFRANGKHRLIRKGDVELPKKHVILLYRKEFAIPSDVRRTMEKEFLAGDWKEYVCEWLDLTERTELRLEHQNDKNKSFTIAVVETSELKLAESPVQLAGRSVFCKVEGEELEVYNSAKTLRIESLSPQQRERAKLFVNDAKCDLTADAIAIAGHLKEGVNEIRLRGARALKLRFAYFPDFKPRLDKTEYRADETPSLSIGDEKFALSSNGHRADIKFKGFACSIPIPRQAWRISGKAWSSEPISLRAQDLPSLQAQTFLEIAHTEHDARLIATSDDGKLRERRLRLEDGFGKVDLVQFRDVANAHQELELLLQIEGKASQPLLRIYREWQPEIRLEINGKTVTFHIQDNVAGFKNREIICWNICRLTEKPIVIAVPDGADRVEHTFEHEGEYVIETRARRTGWGAPKELSPFDVPAQPPLFSVGDFNFEKFRDERTRDLLLVLRSNNQTPIKEDEYLATLAYMVKRNLYHRTIENWIHLFLALREEIRERFQTKLYDVEHQSVQAARQKYEETIKQIVNRAGIVSRFPINSDIDVSFTAMPHRQDNLDGFMLRWKTNRNVVRITNIDAQNLQREGQRFVKTESLKFYTLIVSNAQGQFAIATVAIAREPLILCFQAAQLDN